MCSLKTWDRVKLSLHGHLLECACSYDLTKEKTIGEGQTTMIW